jgi:CSLREA domain-containing protein
MGHLRLHLVLCLLLASSAHAATISVTTTTDELNTDGDCSLREAVVAANTDAAVDACTAGSGADLILLPNGTYTMAVTGAGENDAATGDLDLTGTLQIAGTNRTNTILAGNADDRFFEVRSGATVSLSSMTLQNSTPAQAGGAIHNRASLAINDCTFQNNVADTSTGGAIYSIAGTTLDVSNSVFSGNTADTNGGALANHGTATLTNVSFLSNTATENGGAIYQSPNGSLSLELATLFDNDAGDDGGALYTDAPTTITDSTFILNTVGTGSIGGGAIYCADTVDVSNSGIVFNVSSAWAGGISTTATCALTLTNVTVHGNSAANEGGGIRTAGGGTVTLANATVTANTSDSDMSGSDNGGGIDCASGGTVTLRNSVVADNLTGVTASDCQGTLTSQGHNLLETTTGCTMALGTGDQTGVDPALGTYADNGGSTNTRLPNLGSPLVDAGDPATPGSGGTACAAVDQRGYSRPAGSGCDIGAVERDATASTTTTTLATTTTTSTSTSTTTTVATTTTTSTVASTTTSTTAPPPPTSSTTVPPSTTTTTTLPPPLCQGGAPMQGMTLRIAKAGGTAARLVLGGSLMLGAGTPPVLDPAGSGMQLLIEDLGAGGPLLDLTAGAAPIPPGVKGTGCGPKDGWKGTTYANRSGAVAPPACPPGSAHGLRRLQLKDRRARGRGLSFNLQTAGSPLPMPVGPLRVTLVVGAQGNAGALGLCGTHTFSAGCRTKGTTYRCR